MIFRFEALRPDDGENWPRRARCCYKGQRRFLPAPKCRPMLTLTLFRHAKSSWADPSLEDFDRPLARRGEEAAPLMGGFLTERGLIPDLVLCSASRRTRQTFDLAFKHLKTQPETRFVDEIYHATVPALLSVIRDAPSAKHHLMLVGHNPGLQSLALELIGGGDPAGRRGIAHKFPSAAIAVMTFDAPNWAATRAGGAYLTIFMTPKQLDRSQDDS
jgi:phosphohistidine phosphatase